ncbi:PWWP domain-containing protein 1-like isoform X2 [Malania oleifera]|uniref:PWWP domain-containing protein 1-like isoform X2 n=1 Tax=Malania oleifera TaxID=397392 RepID=UPI0025ADAB07|nr:PWWP domain-containing protein 1-like isoform X2 [Malania oleifera]
MVSVMNSGDCDLDRGSEEPHVRTRVSDDGGVGSSDRGAYGGIDVEKSVNFSVSNEGRTLHRFESEANAGGTVRFLDDHVNVHAELVESENEGSGGVRVRVSDGIVIDDRGVGGETESRVLEDKVEGMVSRDGSYQQNDGNDGMEREGVVRSAGTCDPWNDRTKLMVSPVEAGKYAVSLYDSSLSKFDDFVGKENCGLVNMGVSNVVGYGFEVGDMVWGKVKSHPWWPGHIFNEAFASSSVRRARREGHVLVAFFGDSSYGWFDLAELIHFDPNYTEKSRQMTSRNFVKAVEEAVDETSRRSSLGLACRCRNPYNFRPTNVLGYYAVDVPDYEPGGIYSASQIGKARESFRPGETLSFLKQLAMTPQWIEESSIDWIKNKATVLAYRKAVFEEFDETYAQAFGMQPVRPHQPTIALDQSLKEPARAPLSGPLVMAEALGGGKSLTKPVKVKDQSKKDRYLFKRRDGPNDSKTHQIRQGPARSSAQSSYVQGSTLASGDFVFQKRAPDASTNSQIVSSCERAVDINRDSAAVLAQDVPVKEAVNLDKRPVTAASEVSKSKESKERIELHMVADPTGTVGSILSVEQAFLSAADGSPHIVQQQGDLKYECAKAASKASGVFEQSNQSLPVRVEEHLAPNNVQDGQKGAQLVKLPSEDLKVIDGGVKAKVLKRPVGDLGSAKAIPGDKKKKRKREFGLETGPLHPQKETATGRCGVAVGKLSGKSIQDGSTPREDNQVDIPKKDGVGSFMSDSAGIVGMGNSETELPQLLSDLHALALDPFHGVERKCPATARHFFLRFRSLVYQKSLVLPPAETEPPEVRASKLSVGPRSSDNPPSENLKDMPSSKPPRPLFRTDDPTRAGRKRGPSDRQEEIAAKKLKKMKELKSLAAEKKASLKHPEVQRGEGKETSASAPVKQAKADTAKKMGPPVKATDPTMLIMKFPPRTSLPSVMELKARFARFGPLDHSATRVFWKTSTCRIVFMHKVDAQAAYKYVAGNNSLFGNVAVKYYLKDLEATAPELPELGRGRAEDTSSEILQPRDSGIEQRLPSTPLHQPTRQPAVQLKSCLKKSSGEEAAGPGVGPGPVTGGGSGNVRATPRVKFMLGGEESSRGEQLMVGNRNNYFNNASFADGGASSSSSSVAMEFNSKNFQKVIPPPSPQPILQFPPFLKAPNNLHHMEVLPRNNNYNAAPLASPPPPLPLHIPLPPSATPVDISQQMIGLLTRCNDVVTNLKGFLGYIPYHPL